MTENVDELNLDKTLEKTDAKCPQCAATIEFDPASGMLSCPFCGYSRKVEETKEAEIAQEQALSDAQNRDANFSWGAGKKTVICENCGGESVYDELMVSNVCPYCGSNHIVEAQAQNTIPPTGICPFTVDHGKADVAFQKWIKGRFYAPSAAKKQAKAGAFSGLFLPYWTFDADTFTSYTGKAGRTVTTGSGKNQTTHTIWKNVAGQYQKFVDDEPILASTHHDGDLLRSIEPFDTDAAVDYNPEYLSGFITERYSVGLNDSWVRAQARIKADLESDITSEIKSEHNADQVSSLHLNTLYDNVKYKYLMLPVWTSAFTYKSKIYKFYVNGRTGKVGGKFPISALKVILTILVVLAILLLIIYCSQQ